MFLFPCGKVYKYINSIIITMGTTKIREKDLISKSLVSNDIARNNAEIKTRKATIYELKEIIKKLKHEIDVLKSHNNTLRSELKINPILHNQKFLKGRRPSIFR